VVTKRVSINGVVYTHGELKTLYYLCAVGKVELEGVATYCDVHKPTAHGYVSALIGKGLVGSDEGTTSSTTRYYWCTDKEKAQAVLDDAPSGIIDQNAAFPPRRTKGQKRARYIKINGVALSLAELRILRYVQEAGKPITPYELAELMGRSPSYLYNSLPALLRKQLLGKRRVTAKTYCYWCKDSQSVKAFLHKADEAWPGWR
jgi:hypothetical protein